MKIWAPPPPSVLGEVPLLNDRKTKQDQYACGSNYKVEKMKYFKLGVEYIDMHIICMWQL
jgi:hypothetical protein